MSREASRFTVETARQVCALPDPPESRQVVGPLLVRGERTVLGGHTGEGKTTLSLQMIRASVQGDEFLGFSGSRSRALVIDAEQGLRTVKRRLAEARLDTSGALEYLRVPDGLRLDAADGEADELERVLSVGDYSAVLFDPLYKLHGGDSNEERAAVELMRRLDGWREQYDFALLLNAHCRKPSLRSRFSMHDLFGSSAFLRGAEIVLGLERVGPGRSRLHLFKDRIGDLPPDEVWKLTFDRDEGFQRDPAAERPTATVDLVRTALTDQPGLTIEQLMEITGRSERSIRSALGKLCCESTDTRPKEWTLPEGSEG